MPPAALASTATTNVAAAVVGSKVSKRRTRSQAGQNEAVLLAAWTMWTRKPGRRWWAPRRPACRIGILRMNEKRCSRCGLLKPVTDFRRRAASLGGLTSWCRECLAEYERHRRKRPTVIFYMRHYRHRADVREKRRQARRLRRQRPEVQEKERERRRLYRQQPHVKAKRREEKRRWERKPEVRERTRAAGRRWYAAHQPAELERVRRYGQTERGKATRRTRRAGYRATSRRYVLDEGAGAAVRRALKGRPFSRIWRDRLGYRADQVRAHLLGTIPAGCTASTLEVDHVEPRRSFAYEKVDDVGFRTAWAVENLRLIPGKVNRRKGGKVPQAFGASLVLAAEERDGRDEGTGPPAAACGGEAQAGTG